MCPCVCRWLCLPGRHVLHTRPICMVSTLPCACVLSQHFLSTSEHHKQHVSTLEYIDTVNSMLCQEVCSWSTEQIQSSYSCNDRTDSIGGTITNGIPEMLLWYILSVVHPACVAICILCLSLSSAFMWWWCHDCCICSAICTVFRVQVLKSLLACLLQSLVERLPSCSVLQCSGNDVEGQNLPSPLHSCQFPAISTLNALLHSLNSI